MMKVLSNLNPFKKKKIPSNEISAFELSATAAELKKQRAELHELTKHIAEIKHGMDVLVQAGANGADPVLNSERYEELSRALATAERRRDRLHESILNLQMKQDLDDEFSHIEHLGASAVDIEAEHRRQDIIEIRSETLRANTQALSELQKRRDTAYAPASPIVSDEYSRRVAEARQKAAAEPPKPVEPPTPAEPPKPAEPAMAQHDPDLLRRVAEARRLVAMFDGVELPVPPEPTKAPEAIEAQPEKLVIPGEARCASFDIASILKLNTVYTANMEGEKIHE